MKRVACSCTAVLILASLILFPTSGATLSLGPAAAVSQKTLLEQIFDFFGGFLENIGANEKKDEVEIIIEGSAVELSDEIKIEVERINKEVKAELYRENELITARSAQQASALPFTQTSPAPRVKKPSVLIYHTHTDEAFSKGVQVYSETTKGRTLNADYSVVRVGAELKESLESYGFTVTHDKTDNVSASFKNAYSASLQTITPYINTTDIFIDLHRDAYYGQEPNYCTFGEKRAAYIGFVVAMGQEYSSPPNWQENYRLALKLTEKINELYPGLAKDVVLRDARYNQHVGTSCLLAEFGNEENSLAEVLTTASMLADAMNRIY